MSDEMTVERCRIYVNKCKEKNRETKESKAIEFLLGELDKPTPEPTRELTVDAGFRWLDRWMDVPLARWPHAVKLLYTFSEALTWHRNEREKMIDELNRLMRDAVAFKGSLQIAHDNMLANREPTLKG